MVDGVNGSGGGGGGVRGCVCANSISSCTTPKNPSYSGCVVSTDDASEQREGE